MPANAAAHVRIARPTRDLEAAERFWISGLGLDVLYRHASDGTPDDHSLLMAGWPDAAWHLELVNDPAAPVEPRPTAEDLLVIYLGEPVPDSSWNASNSTAASGFRRTTPTGTRGV